MPSAAALIAAVPAAAGAGAPAPGGADSGSAEAFAAALAGVREGVVKDAPARTQGETASRVSSIRLVGRLDLAGLGEAEGQDVSAAAAALPRPEGAIVQTEASDDLLSAVVDETAEIAEPETPDVAGSLPPVPQGPVAPPVAPASLSVEPSAGTGDEAAATPPASPFAPAAASDAADPQAARMDVSAPLTRAVPVDQGQDAATDAAATPTEGAAALPAQGSDAPPPSRTEKPAAAVERPVPAKAEATAPAAPASAAPTPSNSAAVGIDAALTAATPETVPVVREATGPQPAKTVASTDPLPAAPAAPTPERPAAGAAVTPKTTAADVRSVEIPAAADAGAVQISAVIQKPVVSPAALARPLAEAPAPAVWEASPAATAETDDAATPDAAAEPASPSQDAPFRPTPAAAPLAASIRPEPQPLRPLRHEAPAPSTSEPDDASQAAPSTAAAGPDVKSQAPALADAPSGAIPPPVPADPAAAAVDPTVDAVPAETTPDAARADNPVAQARDPLASALSRATIETTAHLAAQIARKLEGRSTRFDMVLTPEDLGRVDVTVEIDADGQLAARLAFDNPAAAADLRGRADELRRQLQDAGFQLSQDSLDFSQRDPSSGGGAFDRQQQRNALFAGGSRLAAQADLAAAPIPGAWTNHSLTPERVDVRV